MPEEKVNANINVFKKSCENMKNNLGRLRINLNFNIISLFFQIEEEMTLLTSLKIIEDSTSLDSPIHQLNSPIQQSSPQLQLTPVQQSSNNTQSSASTSSFNSTIIQTSPNLSNGDKENNNPAKVCCENL